VDSGKDWYLHAVRLSSSLFSIPRSFLLLSLFLSLFLVPSSSSSYPSPFRSLYIFLFLSFLLPP
jgi:hypothetical protein